MVWGGKLVVWGGLGCFHGPSQNCPENNNQSGLHNLLLSFFSVLLLPTYIDRNSKYKFLMMSHATMGRKKCLTFT